MYLKSKSTPAENHVLMCGTALYMIIRAVVWMRWTTLDMQRLVYKCQSGGKNYFSDQFRIWCDILTYASNVTNLPR